MRQSPRNFWKYIVDKMRECGLEQSKLDPCLFVGERVICIAYVDNLLFWSKDESKIHKLAASLRTSGMVLEQEDDAAGFLGVKIERNAAGQLEMAQ